MVVKWALTNKCNLNCKHCYNADLRNPMDFINFQEALRTVEDMSKNYVSNVQFLGGEPLLYPHLQDIISKCTSLGITSWINTNGTLIDEEYAKELINAGIESIIFSIDGPNSIINDNVRGRGSFDKAIKGLEYILKYRRNNTQVAVNTVLSKDAVFAFDDMVDFIKEYSEIDGFTIGLPDIVGNAAMQDKETWADYNLYYESLLKFSKKLSELSNLSDLVNIEIGAPPLVKWYLDKKFKTRYLRMSKEYCMGASSVYFIDADGILYPCNLPSGIKYFREMYSYEYLVKNCNIHTKLFSNIYIQKEYLHFFQYVRSRDLSTQERYSDSVCSKCTFSWLHLCGIACPTEANRYSHSRLCEIVIGQEKKNFLNEIAVSLNNEGEV